MSEENILTSAISKKISRRSFLKWSAALGATASASGLVAQTGLKMAGATAGSYEPYTTQGGDWLGTVCLVCHSWCQKAVLVNSGVARKIEGLGGQPRSGCVALDNSTDAEYVSAGAGFLPYSLHNRGRICAKGNDGLEHLYDPERIKYPLKRVGARGAGKWTKITWDAAYTEIGNVLREMAGKTTDVNGDPLNQTTSDPNSTYKVVGGARGIDLRHRQVTYIGRNETGSYNGNVGFGFTKNYGSPNHVQHTSICELSRHVAHWLTFGDKFPLPDLQTHNDTITGTVGGLHDGSASAYDVDFYANSGGNWAEATLPHASYASRVTDIRRRGARIVGIDVRQSNSLACSDEQFFITPGTDAAMALGIIHQMLSTAGCDGTSDANSAAAKALLDAGHLDGKYVGIFRCQEASGSEADGKTPDGKSLESYVFGTGDDAAVKNAAWASAICGIAAADITYLGKAMGGETVSGALRYNNPVFDGYRGAAQHTNGAYAFRALRAMQTIAGINNPSAKYRGGVDRPGGLMMDAWGGAAGWLGSSSAGFGNGGTSSSSGMLPAFVAAHPEVSTGGEGVQPLWAWDYDLGLPKWKLAKGQVDQNLVPAIRTSIGLAPYVVGALRTTEVAPFDAWDNGLGAGDYKVEALLEFKNASAFSRANIDLDVECFTATDGNGDYRLPHHWQIDLYMGASSRFCDIVLPDTSYLERYDLKNPYENFALKNFIQMRQPVVNNLYSAKQIKQILWELARYIEDPLGVSGGSEAPWNGKLMNAYRLTGNSYNGTVDPGNGVGKPGDVDVANAWTFAGGATAPTSLMAIETNIINACNSTSIPGATRLDKFDFMRDHGAYWTATTKPNYFPHGSRNGETTYGGGLKTSGEGRIEIYQTRLAATTDPTIGNLLGYPAYVPTTQQTSGTWPLHLTTYKLNVHTQSRTASCPRLMEIIGNDWAVIHPTTAAAQVPAIVNGDTVKITTAEGEVTLEAKVTEKAQVGCVHVSHSIGDEYVNNGPYAHGSSKGRYAVDNVDDRADAVTAAGSPGAAAYSAYNATATGYSTVSPDAIGRVGASAPLWRADGVDVNGSAAHPNHAINRTASGTWTNPDGSSFALSIGTAAGMTTDPVGGSLAWFDSKCKIEKV